jgi:GPH family glycoside/pentoside/hexuronide:cation symporter
VVVLFIGFTMRNGTALYYFKYNIGHSELAGAFLGLQGLFGIAGALSATFLARRFDKRATMSIGMGIFALASLVNFVAGDSLPVAIANGALGGFGLVLAAAMVFAMVADCVDFAEGRSGIKAAGIAAALITAGTKFSTAVGGAIVGFALAAAGYVANQQQNAGSLTAIRDLITIVPAAFAVVAIAIIWFYPLSAARMVGVQRDLSA